MENFKFKLNIGDASNNGHGKFETYIIESNFISEEIEEIYEKTVDKIGASPSDFFEDYEDNKLSSEDISNLGLSIDNYMEEYYDEFGYHYFNSNSYCRLIIDFIMTHNTDVTMSIISDDLPTLDLGIIGYGLFY